jgi:hypothetical protein
MAKIWTPMPPIWLSLCGMAMCRMLEDMQVSDAPSRGSPAYGRSNDVGLVARAKSRSSWSQGL